MDNPSPVLRRQMQIFYKSLRENDIATLTTLHDNGLPLSWVQSMAEQSLPEYAMRHNAPEAAWWLMSQGVMPEDWSSFTGSAWKSFLKSGWEMVNSKDTTLLSFQVYTDIVKAGLKVSGERMPEWLDGVLFPAVHQTVQDTMRHTTRVATALVSRLGGFLRKPDSADARSVEENTASVGSSPTPPKPKKTVSTKTSIPTSVDPMTSARLKSRQTQKKPIKKTATKATKRPKSM